MNTQAIGHEGASVVNYPSSGVEMNSGVCSSQQTLETVETGALTTVVPASKSGIVAALHEQIRGLIRQMNDSQQEFSRLQRQGSDPVRFAQVKQDLVNELNALKAFLEVLSINIATASPEVREAEQRQISSFLILTQQMEVLLNQTPTPVALEPQNRVERQSPQSPNATSGGGLSSAGNSDVTMIENVLRQLVSIYEKAQIKDMTAEAARAARGNYYGWECYCCDSIINAAEWTRKIVGQLEAKSFDPVLFNATCWELNSHNGAFIVPAVDAMQPLLASRVYEFSHFVAKQSRKLKSACFFMSLTAGAMTGLGLGFCVALIIPDELDGLAACSIAGFVIGGGLFLSAGIAYGACKSSCTSKAEEFKRSLAV